MTNLKIIVKDYEDMTPAEPQVTSAIMLDIKSFIVLERGTASGDTSIAIRAEDNKGNSYIVQMTGNMFRGAHGAFKGADERFKEKQAKKN